jgi:hypothetical protein
MDILQVNEVFLLEKKPHRKPSPARFNPQEHPRDPDGQFRSGGGGGVSQGKRVTVHAQISHSSTKDALLLTNIKIDGTMASRNHINLRMKDFAKDASIDHRIKPGAFVVVKGVHTSYVHNGQVKESLTEVTSIKLVS